MFVQCPALSKVVRPRPSSEIVSRSQKAINPANSPQRLYTIRLPLGEKPGRKSSNPRFSCVTCLWPLPLALITQMRNSPLWFDS